MKKFATTVRFYAELNDFVPPDRRFTDIGCSTHRTSVKDLIERLGVPHTEVDLVLVNGKSAPFSHIVGDGDRISVYPVFETLDIGDVTSVRPEPLRELRFVLDTHLGKLAGHLRLLGFDSLYRNDWPDEELARVTVEERRVLLTRDRGLLKRSAIERGYCVRHDDPEAQLAEVVQRFQLARLARPFGRCPRCNSRLVDVEKRKILEQLEPKTKLYYDTFQQCEGCGRIYWRGSHYERLEALLRGALEAGNRATPE